MHLYLLKFSGDRILLPIALYLLNDRMDLNEQQVLTGAKVRFLRIPIYNHFVNLFIP